MTDTLLVVTTFTDRQEALDMGRHLLERRLVACAQVSGPVESLYWWQGKIEHEREYRLLMKSSQTLWGALEKEIAERHSYEVPEIIATAVSAVNNSYLGWLDKELQQ